MMEENPILLWKIKCYKQKASGKADLHTMFYLYIYIYIYLHTHFQYMVCCLYWYGIISIAPLFCEEVLLPSAIFAAIFSTVHGFCENVASVLVWYVLFVFPVER